MFYVVNTLEYSYILLQFDCSLGLVKGSIVNAPNKIVPDGINHAIFPGENLIIISLNDFRSILLNGIHRRL